MNRDDAVVATAAVAHADGSLPSQREPHDYGVPPSEHLVLLYETERTLAARVVRFLTPGLLLDEALLVVATPEHRRLLGAALTAAGADLPALRRAGTYVELDAEETLAAFLVDGRLNRMGFNSVVGHRVRTMSAAHGRVHIYGEMVACLWGRGGAAEAVELECFWDDLASSQEFRLCCAYPAEFLRESQGLLDDMLHKHSAVERR